MKTFETSVKLNLLIKGNVINLFIDINVPQYKGKKLIVPDSHTFVENDKSNILFQYTEKEDAEIVTSSQIQNKYNVQLGSLSKGLTSNELSTLGDYATATRENPNPILSQYSVALEITGDSNRKTVTHISDDADIDLEIE